MYRKISEYIEEYLKSDDNKILCIEGARQVGKTYIIRELAKKHFKNYIELNMTEDKKDKKLFEKVGTVKEFYIQVSVVAGDKLNNRNDTVIFIDEIQEYPKLFSLLKPLAEDNRFKYICSGSELGIALSSEFLSPMGYVTIKRMYPMDFEEFLIANSVGSMAINHLKECYDNKKSVNLPLHQKILELFKTYLYVGGMPSCVDSFIKFQNVAKIKDIQDEIIEYYSNDASKYDRESNLVIKRIYDLIPSNIENKVKRIQISSIENKKDARFERYQNEFDYLLTSGISLGVKAISEPRFPLIQSTTKNSIKLYMNDVGLLTDKLYKNNINAILNEESGVNLGAVYETVVAQELRCHGHDLYYYDRKKVGEVDFIINDYDNLCPLPIEIKSGKDYRNFRALPKLLNSDEYRIKKGYVLSNKNEVLVEGKIVYMPIYFVMFL